MLGTDSPAAMMFNLSSGGIDGGVAMGFSMSGISGMGLGKMSTTGRPDDEERRKRLIEILRLLGTRYPRISPEGVEALGNRYGLDAVVEPPDRFKEMGECVVAGRNGSFMVTVCYWSIFQLGGADRCQIPFTLSKQISSATFNFSDKASDAVRKHEAGAQKAIMKSLSLDPGQSYITSSLERFGKNLERLARMDKLCGTGFSCFEAIAGVYSSLEKLYGHEKKIAMTVLDATKGDIGIRAQREVMCKKSGRPAMNPRKTVGLALDYWMDNRKVLKRHRCATTQSSKGKDPEAMDADSVEDSDEWNQDTYYSLIIECEDNPSVEMYQSARISNAWLSDQVEKQSEDPNDLFGPTIDWQDPPPTFLNEPTAPPADGSLQLDESHMGKLPAVRFVAKLDPPLVLPQPVAANLLASVNASLPESDAVRTYTGLLLDTDATEDYNAIFMAQTKQVHSTTLALVPEERIADGKFVECKHSNTLFVNKPEFGRILEEIPFSHPKQLAQLLPTLRQYAFLNQILSETFKARKSHAGQVKDSKGSNGPSVRKVDIDLLSAITPRFSVSFSDIISPSRNGLAPPTPDSINLDDLLKQNSAGEDVEMIDRDKQEDLGVLSALVEILPNAGVQVVEHNLVPSGKYPPAGGIDANAEPDPQEQVYGKVGAWLSKALDNMGGELGCWTEAMARKAKVIVESS